MTLEEIKAQVMFQTNNDVEDLDDFEPHLNDYINEGYDRLVYSYTGAHVAAETDYSPLAIDSDVPALPMYSHRALVDYATYLVYRNGNSVKQNRGMAFYGSFSEIESRLMSERATPGNATMGGRRFINIYS